jgi:hypothetical protein
MIERNTGAKLASGAYPENFEGEGLIKVEGYPRTS